FDCCLGSLHTFHMIGLQSNFCSRFKKFTICVSHFLLDNPFVILYFFATSCRGIRNCIGICRKGTHNRCFCPFHPLHMIRFYDYFPTTLISWLFTNFYSCGTLP